MKIAQILTASTGGIGRHVASVAVRLRDCGHQVQIYCPEITDRAQGFTTLGLDVAPLAALTGLSGRTRRRGDGPGRTDVLHAHGYKAGGLALPVRLVTRKPLVVTWHNALLGQPRNLGASPPFVLRRAVARHADLTLGASSDLVDQARILGARRVRLAPVAAPGLRLDPDRRAAVRAQLGLAADDLAVLTVSRLAPQKNLMMLAEIAAELRDVRSIRFLVVGEGPERARLTARIAADGSQVALLGSRDDLSDLMVAADLALLTSTWEARALVAQEALLAGLPLVSTAVGGIPELVGDAAWLVDSNDAAAAAAALRTLAADPSARIRWAAAGRAQAATWPDEDDVVDDLLTAYAGLIRAN